MIDLYLFPKTIRLIKTVDKGDKALIVCTMDTGIIDVALCEVMCPVNWKTPIGNVELRIKGVGSKNAFRDEILDKSGIVPRGKMAWSFSAPVLPW